MTAAVLYITISRIQVVYPTRITVWPAPEPLCIVVWWNSFVYHRIWDKRSYSVDLYMHGSMQCLNKNFAGDNSYLFVWIKNNKIGSRKWVCCFKYQSCSWKTWAESDAQWVNDESMTTNVPFLVLLVADVADYHLGVLSWYMYSKTCVEIF